MRRVSTRAGRRRSVPQSAPVARWAITLGARAQEFFQILVRELFSAKHGLFVEVANGLHWFSSRATARTAELRLVGRVVGLAVHNNVILDLRFPAALYRKMLQKSGRSESLDDLRSLQPEVAVSLQRLLDMDANDVAAMGATFEVCMCVCVCVCLHACAPATATKTHGGGGQITVEADGAALLVDLLPNGARIPVTPSNRQGEPHRVRARGAPLACGAGTEPSGQSSCVGTRSTTWTTAWPGSLRPSARASWKCAAPARSSCASPRTWNRHAGARARRTAAVLRG
jgi:hypothetical protein